MGDFSDEKSLSSWILCRIFNRGFNLNGRTGMIFLRRKFLFLGREFLLRTPGVRRFFMPDDFLLFRGRSFTDGFSPARRFCFLAARKNLFDKGKKIDETRHGGGNGRERLKA